MKTATLFERLDRRRTSLKKMFTLTAPFSKQSSTAASSALGAV